MNEKRILNKAEKTLGKKQYHIHLRPEDVGEYALLPGDPARSDMVAQHLENPRLVGNNREHRSYTGMYKGAKITVTSTGMGCPSATIAAEELMNIGVKYFIRIGSSAALREGIAIGDLIISTAAMKNEGTSRFYVPDCFPAVPDFDLTRELINTAEELKTELGYELHYGINACDDSFYGENEQWLENLSSLGCLNVEMESSGIYTVCGRRGCKAAMICAVSGNLMTGDVVYESFNEKLAIGWEHEIQVALETLSRIEQKRRQTE